MLLLKCTHCPKHLNENPGLRNDVCRHLKSCFLISITHWSSHSLFEDPSECITQRAMEYPLFRYGTSAAFILSSAPAEQRERPGELGRKSRVRQCCACRGVSQQGRQHSNWSATLRVLFPLGAVTVPSRNCCYARRHVGGGVHRPAQSSEVLINVTLNGGRRDSLWSVQEHWRKWDCRGLGSLYYHEP